MTTLKKLKRQTTSVGVSSFLLLVTILPISTDAAPRVDQSQTRGDYGFWFEQSVKRWQEFAPSLPNLTQLSILVTKRGEPGDVIVELTDHSFRILYKETLASHAVPSGVSWLEVPLREPIALDTSRLYRIRVYSDRVSTEPVNRYFWGGSNTDNYGQGARNSVYSSWPNFDFAFITYALPDPVTISNLSVPAIKAALERREQ